MNVTVVRKDQSVYTREQALGGNQLTQEIVSRYGMTPEEAEKIDLARSVGNLSLVLRNQVDKEDAQTSGIHKPELLLGSSEPEPVVAAHAVRKAVKRRPSRPKVVAENNGQTVEVIKGLNRSNVEF